MVEASAWDVDRERLVELMQSFPYSLPEAVADLIDNSIDANSKNITVELDHNIGVPYVLIKDDGIGITPDEMDNIISIGKKRDYHPSDLGKFGVGLKTAGLSQARNVTVFSKTESGKMSIRRISVDWMKETGNFHMVLHSSTESPVVDQIMERGHLPSLHGTTILLEGLHRFDTLRIGNNNDSHTLIDTLEKLESHLAMVYHRFVEDPNHPRHFSLHFTAKGGKIEPLNPFEPHNTDSRYGTLTRSSFVKINGEQNEKVPIRLVILSHGNQISNPNEHRERIKSAIGSWSGAEGAYLYRNDRLVAHSQWFGIPDISKTAVGTLRRVEVNIDSSLDDFFGLSPSKSAYRLPMEFRYSLKELMDDKFQWVAGEKAMAFSTKAQKRYRNDGKSRTKKRKQSSVTKRVISQKDAKTVQSNPELNPLSNDAAEEISSETGFATSAIVKPVSIEKNPLISHKLQNQELHIEVNMNHPWYLPFKSALKEWLGDG